VTGRESPALLGNALLLGFLRSRLAQRGGRAAARQLALFLLLLSKSEQLGVLVGVGLGLGDAVALESLDASRPLKDDGRDEALDLGSLRLGLLLTFLQFDGSSDDVLSDVIVFFEVEELADFAGSFGSQTTGDGCVGESWDIGFSLLDDDKVEHGQVSVDDASSDTPAVTLAGTSGSVARVHGAEKKADTSVGQHSLHHWESLLVVTAANAENVTLPFVSERVSRYFLGHLLVEEDSQFAVIFDLDQLLASGRRIGNVQLHCFLIL